MSDIISPPHLFFFQISATATKTDIHYAELHFTSVLPQFEKTLNLPTTGEYRLWVKLGSECI